MFTKKIYRSQRDSNPVPPGSESTTLPMSYPGTLVGTHERPCSTPTDALPTYLTLYGPRSGPVRDTYGHRPSPGNVFRNEDKSSLIAGRVPAGTRQDSRRVSVKHDLIMTTEPGARQGLRSRPCSQPGRGPGSLCLFDFQLKTCKNGTL